MKFRFLLLGRPSSRPVMQTIKNKRLHHQNLDIKINLVGASRRSQSRKSCSFPWGSGLYRLTYLRVQSLEIKPEKSTMKRQLLRITCREQCNYGITVFFPPAFDAFGRAPIRLIDETAIGRKKTYRSCV